MKQSRLLIVVFLAITFFSCTSIATAYPMMLGGYAQGFYTSDSYVSIDRGMNTFHNSYSYRTMHNTADDYYFYHRSYDSGAFQFYHRGMMYNQFNNNRYMQNDYQSYYRYQPYSMYAGYW